MKRLTFIFLLFVSHSLWGQNPVANFTTPLAACLQEKLTLTNNSTNADTYAWDFCLNDFFTLKSTTDAAILSGLSGGYGYKLIQSNGQWFGFATSLNNNKLFRLAFGNDPSNVPIVTDLGNPGNKLFLPEGIDITEVNGEWFGFVGSLDFSSPAQGIIRLDFGNSLMNLPSATNLGNFGFSTRFRDLKIIKQDADLILLLSNYNGNSLVGVNYRDSFENPISAPNIFDFGTITGMSLPVGLDVVKVNANWIALVASRGNSQINQLNFGSNILSVPSVEGSYSFSGVSNPYKIKLTLEGDNYFAVVSNESIPIQLIDFHDLNSANAPSAITHAGLPVLLGIESIRNKGLGLVIGVGLSDNKLKRVTFEAPCNASNAYSESVTPSDIVYTTSGNKKIELVAQQGNLTSVVAGIISVSSSTAPDITILTNGNSCASNSVAFTAENISNDIVNHNWNFGDALTSLQANPSHVYSSAGVYNLSLQVTASNGCNNNSHSQITIYNQPVSVFSLPAVNPFCTNQEYIFTNTSSFDTASNPTWEWSLNGNVISNSKDLLTQFSTTSSQQIKLKSLIPGCENESIQNVNTILQGPTVDFNAANGCQESPLNFVNTSTGTVTGYTWNFGDGNQSSLVNPTNTFLQHGNFDVVLTATNAAGCENSKTKSITIYSKPQTNFSIDLPPFSCSGSASQFNDLTPPLTDSNITAWTWNFGDAANGTSSQRNPTYVYGLAADYQVSLETSTNFGCTNSVQKTVTISTPPAVGFNTDIACLNQATRFTDASDVTVKAWLWSIENSSYATKNAMHTFNTAGSHDAMLTVTGTNNCVSQLTKTVTVPLAVVPDFTAISTCADKPAVFQEKNIGGGDPAVSWSWDFGGTAGSGSPAQHTFTALDNYEVKMSSTRQSGCVYSITKSVSITQAPVAQFSASPEIGAAPLAVGFTNTSTQATSYVWRFNDVNNSNSTEFSPSYIFNQLGSYPVQLIASNSIGCEDSFNKTVQVVVPAINVALADFKLVPSGNSMIIEVTIQNLGNVPILNPEIIIDLSGKALFKQNLIGTILPNQELTRELQGAILQESINYLCARVNVKDDVDLSNNRQCQNFDAEVIVIQPYPNPAQNELFIDWINKNDESLSLNIYNASGQLVVNQKFESLTPGLNQLRINVSNLPAGSYYVLHPKGTSYPGSRFSIVR